MLNNLDDMGIHGYKEAMISMVFIISSLVEYLDVGVRIGSGLIGIVIGVYAVIRLRSQIKVNNAKLKSEQLDQQIKEQQLYDIIESNRKKHK